MINLYQRAFTNARRQQQESLRKFATRLGVTHPLLSRIENGKQLPSSRLVQKLEQVTGYAFPVLVQGVFEESPASNKGEEVSKQAS